MRTGRTELRTGVLKQKSRFFQGNKFKLLNVYMMDLFIIMAVFFALPQISAAEVDVKKGLVLHYTFEEDFGEVAWDKSGNGNWGEFKGNTKRANGNWGKA